MFAALLLAAQLTLAPPPPAATPAPTQTSWYGYQILAVDVLALSAALTFEHPAPLLFALASGPAVHALHGHGQRALFSGLRRTALPVMGIFAGFAACDDDDDDGDDHDYGLECLGPAVGGFVLGVAVAEVWDLAVATDELPLTPIVSANGETTVLGLAGRF